MEFVTPVKSSHNPLVVTFFMTIDGRFVILWNFEFLNNICGSSNFRKIWAIALKLHININIIYRSRNFGIEFGQTRLKRSNFLRFWIFWKSALNRITCANLDLSSSNFVCERTNTEYNVSCQIWWESD